MKHEKNMIKCKYCKTKLTDKTITTYEKVGDKYEKIIIPICLKHQGMYEGKVLQIEKEKDPEKNYLIFQSLEKESKLNKFLMKISKGIHIAIIILLILMIIKNF